MHRVWAEFRTVRATRLERRAVAEKNVLHQIQTVYGTHGFRGKASQTAVACKTRESNTSTEPLVNANGGSWRPGNEGRMREEGGQGRKVRRSVCRAATHQHVCAVRVATLAVRRSKQRSHDDLNVACAKTQPPGAMQEPRAIFLARAQGRGGVAVEPTPPPPTRPRVQTS